MTNKTNEVMLSQQSTISLIAKVTDNCIAEARNNAETIYEIHVDCIGLDCIGKLLNIYILTTSRTYEEANKIVSTLSLNTIHFIRGVFCIDSDDNYDIITVYNPIIEQVSEEDRPFCEERFKAYKVNKGDLLLRKVCQY